MKNFETYDVDEELKITGLPANHPESACPRHLYIEYKGKKIYYALDGAWMTNGEFSFIAGKKLDLLVLDCTCGDYTGDFRAGEHNSIPMLRLLIPSLKTVGAIDENTKVYCSHFAPSLHKSHEETEKILEEIKIRAAYDGLKIEL